MNAQVNSLLSGLGRSWWVLLIYGIVGILFGIAALIHPLWAAATLTWAIGLVSLVEGVISLIALFAPAQGISKGWLAFYGIVSVLFGVVALANPFATASSLILLLAIWLIIAGIYRIAFAIRVRKEIQGEWLIILSGVLAILLGVLFAANPLAGMVVSALWIGAGALIYGLFQTAAAFRLRKLSPR